MAVFRLFFQQISVLSHIDSPGGHDLLPLGIDGRVGHLGKKLLEIIKQRLILPGKCRDRRVDAHGTDLFRPVQGHRKDSVMIVFPGISERFLQFFPLCVRK